MRIEVLYIADCPHHPPTMVRLRQVLADEGVAAHIEEVMVEDPQTAATLGFRGSPSIRVNGLDIADESDASPQAAMCCRLYAGAAGVPPVEMIQKALREARCRENS